MEIKDKLLDKFSADGLYKYLIKHRYTEKDLFPTVILELNRQKVYSTVEIAAIIKRNDNDVRNLLKLLIQDNYIIDKRTGRNYKLDIFDVYRIFLANAITQREGWNYNDIKFALGLIEMNVKGNRNNNENVTVPLEKHISLGKRNAPMLEKQISQALKEDAEKINLKAEQIKNSTMKVNEYLIESLKLEKIIQSEKIDLGDLELEERDIYGQIINLRSKISLLDVEFKGKLNQIKWNHLLLEMKSVFKDVSKKDYNKMNADLDKLIDINIEVQLEEIKDNIALTAKELASAELKRSTLQSRIDTKRSEISGYLKKKEQLILQNQNILVLF